MVVVMKPNASKEDIAKLAAELEQLNLKVSITEGHGCSILGLVGDTTAVDMDKITINQHVERVMRVSEPYKGQPQVPSRRHRGVCRQCEDWRG